MALGTSILIQENTAIHFFFLLNKKQHIPLQHMREVEIFHILQNWV